MTPVPSAREPVVLEQVSKRMRGLAERHARGEDVWRQAELGTPGGTLLHRIARMLVRSREPLTRTVIMERLGKAVPGAEHTARMETVLDVPTAHSMFVDVTGRGALAGRPPRRPVTQRPRP